MGDKSKIEWTDATWNPLRGCTRISEGCRNCYAERIAARFSGPGQPYDGLAKMTPSGPRWTGEVRLIEDKLIDPLRWRKPRMVFANSMSDLFHEDVPEEFIDEVFAVMALCPQHTFQILTKRPERMLRYCNTSPNSKELPTRKDAIEETIRATFGPHGMAVPISWPLPNVWLGVSVENQAAADKRIPLLLQTPAAVRFLSCEPLLGPVDLMSVEFDRYTRMDVLSGCGVSQRSLAQTIPNAHCNPVDWVIVGGESGPNARPMHPDWARSIRDQCQEAGVPFFFKQWGEWMPHDGCWDGIEEKAIIATDGEVREPFGGWGLDFARGWEFVVKVGKKAAGALLDGEKWREIPEVATVG